jgi:hypothetical protein
VTASNTLLLALFTLWSWCIVGIGQVHRLLRITIVSTAINVAVSVVLTWQLKSISAEWAILGPLLGTTVSFVATYIWFLPLLLRQVFSTSVNGLVRAAGMPLLLGVPYGLACWWIARSHTPWGWLGLAVEMSASALLYLGLAWIVVLTRSERDELWMRVRSFLPGKTA